MSEGRRSKLSSTSVLHQSSAKRIFDDEDEEERNSPKKFRADGFGVGHLGNGEGGVPVAADVHEKKVSAKRGRKRKNPNPALLPENCSGEKNSRPSDPLATPQPSSSGTSLVQAPCKTPEKHVHFHLENVADFMDIITMPPGDDVTDRGVSSKDQGVQVRLDDAASRGVVTSVANRGVQTVESSWNVRGVVPAVPCDSQGGRKPVNLVPEAWNSKMTAVQGGSNQAARKEPEAGGSKTSDLHGAKQQVPEAGTCGETVDAGSCEARRGATTSSTRVVHKEETNSATILDDHRHVHLELVIEFLLLCFVMWFFKYR